MSSISINSALETALGSLPESTERIYLARLVDIIERKTGYNRESIYGTIGPSAPNNTKIWNNPNFRSNWQYVKRNHRTLTSQKGAYLVRTSIATKDEKTLNRHESYDSPGKWRVRNEILDVVYNHVAGNYAPIILTPGATEGICVKQILDRFDNEVIVINSEIDAGVLEDYRKLQLPSIDYLLPIEDVVEEKPFTFDLVNYDVKTFMSQSFHESLLRFNKVSNKIIYLSVTMSESVKKIRNTGDWVDWARANYGYYDDPSFTLATEILSNFEYIDSFCWKKEQSTSQTMRALLFKGRG
jgi:hypothetical protein